jgi:hypothetical protein
VVRELELFQSVFCNLIARQRMNAMTAVNAPQHLMTRLAITPAGRLGS